MPAPRRTAVPRVNARVKAREVADTRILETATEVFSEKGYGATTVADIVDRAGISRGAFYLYYDNKTEVFRALVKQMVRDLYDIQPPKSAPGGIRERVRLSTRAFLEGWARHRGVLRCLFEASSVDPQLSQWHNRYREEFVRRIERHLERMIEAGACKPLDPKVTAFSLGGMIGGLAYMWLCNDFDPWPNRPMKMDELVESVTDFWCRTVYSDAVLTA